MSLEDIIKIEKDLHNIIEKDINGIEKAKKILVEFQRSIFFAIDEEKFDEQKAIKIAEEIIMKRLQTISDNVRKS